MNLFEAEDKGFEGSYVAPDPLFISAISLFSNSFPWERFKNFFKSKQLLGLNGDEQVILLRFLAIQELLCLDDKTLLRWLKHQFYLFNFLQPDFKPRLPTLELFQQFRSELDKIGLLLPFRKQCQHIIEEHGKRFPELNLTHEYRSKKNHQDKSAKYSASSLKDGKLRDSQENHFEQDKNADIHNLNNPDVNNPNNNHQGGRSCENCGSQNVISLKPTQEKSSLPDIRFLRCRFCGHTFRA